MKVFRCIEELTQVLGTHVGYSGWHTIAQQQIDTFAEATNDRQWIHVEYVLRSSCCHLRPAAVVVTKPTSRVTIEREGGDKPACVAGTVSVLIP
ncbi:MaoC/PaaZ C-terminal domain-containing protein [Saccharopolyspora spinosa]|uniref:MaoC dehydratase-like protein n=1 Tax=Saccharopolyspora spinosa TaxID=60894 RepID=A0A2N3Y1N3_SACSN|nr:MaoC/PaaZ C-terminal domain-containing protein [Saccharopolyspora spinosa]PKW16827.1 MaoC dehydratase-like protein [Saccharopolyspora spinosa]